MYKALLFCTVSFHTRTKQISAEEVFIQKKHVFPAVATLEIWIFTLYVICACCQNVLFSGLVGVVLFEY